MLYNYIIPSAVIYIQHIKYTDSIRNIFIQNVESLVYLIQRLNERHPPKIK